MEVTETMIADQDRRMDESMKRLSDQIDAVIADRAKLSRLLREALNGWGAHARSKMELDDIARIHKEAADD